METARSTPPTKPWLVLMDTVKVIAVPTTVEKSVTVLEGAGFPPIVPEEPEYVTELTQ